MKYFGWILILISASCISKPHEESSVTLPGATLVADTIIYDVIIRNRDPEDEWTNRCLQNLQHEKLIDSLFSMVYSGKAKAFNYDSEKFIKPNDLSKAEREDEFSRAAIGKIQFTERWYLDNSDQVMKKEVISLVLGHELYTESGDFIGYKPVFRIQLNP
jgi:hypothetical protein